MKNLKCAFRTLSEHLGRTILTILALALFMGTLAFTLSPVLYNAPLRYLGILSKNDVKAIQITADDPEKTTQTFQKYFPEGHRFFSLYDGFAGETGIAFENEDLNRRLTGVCNMTADDYSDMGFETEYGALPKPGEYAISLALYERLKKTGLKLYYDANGTAETRNFETFEDLKALFASKYVNEGHGFVAAPIRLSGVVDTDYKEVRETKLSQAVEAAEEGRDRENAEAALADYLKTAGTLYVFADPEREVRNESGRYLTALPKTSAERKALFAAIQSNLRAHANPFGKNPNIEISVVEADYDQEFYEIVTGGYAAAMMTMPAAIAFGLLSILLMWRLSRACAKTTRSAILSNSKLGMKRSRNYGISLLRCLISAVFAFVLSIGIAYLCRFIFANGGIVDQICASMIEGWDASERNFIDVDYFGFLSFFLALLSGLAIALFGSFVGVARVKNARTESDAEESEEEEGRKS